MPCQHLVVDRVTKGESIRDARYAAVGPIADELPLCPDDLPEEWKQQLATRGGVVIPEALPQGSLILPDAAVRFVEELGIRVRGFLPA